MCSYRSSGQVVASMGPWFPGDERPSSTLLFYYDFLPCIQADDIFTALGGIIM